MRHDAIVFFLAVLACAALSAGCDSGGQGTPGPDQAESQTCDPKFGVDACGAGLFCAAFDNRKYYTCYRLGTRQRGQSCTADNQCAFDDCTSGVCARASVGMPCQSSNDCKSGHCSRVCYTP